MEALNKVQQTIFRVAEKPWAFLTSPGARDPSPEFSRFSLKIEAKILPGTKVNAPYIEKYFEGVIKVAGMQAFTKPIILTPDRPNSDMIVADGYSEPKIPFHSQGIVYVTAPAGETIPPGFISAADQPLIQSNISFYYFPDNGLITILVDTCKESNREQILDYTYDYIRPKSMRDWLIHSAKKGWKGYKKEGKQDIHPEKKYLASIMDLLNYEKLDDLSENEIIERGMRLERLVMVAKGECKGRLYASLIPEMQKKAQALYTKTERIQERRYAYGQLDGSIPLDQPFIHHDRYMQINTIEVKELGLCPGKTVGVIGPGHHSETVFNIYAISGADVIAFEQDHDTAVTLRALVQMKGLADHIKVVESKVGGILDHQLLYDELNTYLDNAARDTYIVETVEEAKAYLNAQIKEEGSFVEADRKKIKIGIRNYKGTYAQAVDLYQEYRVKYKPHIEISLFTGDTSKGILTARHLEKEKREATVKKSDKNRYGKSIVFKEGLTLDLLTNIKIAAGDPLDPFPRELDTHKYLQRCDGGIIIASLARGKPFIYNAVASASSSAAYYASRAARATWVGQILCLVRYTDGDDALLYRPTDANLFNTELYHHTITNNYVNTDPEGILSFYTLKLDGEMHVYTDNLKPEWREE